LTLLADKAPPRYIIAYVALPLLTSAITAADVFACRAVVYAADFSPLSCDAIVTPAMIFTPDAVAAASAAADAALRAI